MEKLLMTFEVLTLVKKAMLVFWVVTLCALVGRYRCLRGTYCLHLQGLVATYKSIRHYNPEYEHGKKHCLQLTNFLPLNEKNCVQTYYIV
jgi:hypothetical protein